MKITRVETLHADGGWRPWTFVKMQTDDGLTGWGECSDSRNPLGIAGCVRDFEPILTGQDPRPVERLYWDLLRRARQNLGGVSHKAIAGIELALWDIKAKALGVPVYELWGGPLRDHVRLYWSHCATTRAIHGDKLSTPPLRTLDDIAALGREVVRRGFTALKTNIVIPGDPPTAYFPGFAQGLNTTDGVVSVEMLRAIERLIGTFRDAVGPDVGLCLDLNYNFRTEGVLRIAKLLERFDMLWLEYDTWDPQALLQIKESTTTRLASCESLITTRQYRPFLELHATDVAVVDVPWNGFGQAMKIATMAETYEIAVAPHNYYSHLADFHSVHFCAALPNVRIMEIDVDDVPWKADLVTRRPVIRDGQIMLPTEPGWGADINEDALRAHPWRGSAIL
jgi:L-alanine-DL-glutamate epimerase-like enolase superfamily enzyme